MKGPEIGFEVNFVVLDLPQIHIFCCRRMGIGFSVTRRRAVGEYKTLFTWLWRTKSGTRRYNHLLLMNNVKSRDEVKLTFLRNT